MKLKNKTVTILLISIFILSVIGEVSADDVSYTISSLTTDMTVNTNGSISIMDTIDYFFDSDANGVYRTIPYHPGESIKNINVTTEGAYSTYTVIHNDGEENIRIYLYADAAHTKKISPNCEVKVKISYELCNNTQIYTDTGMIFCKVLGSEWDQKPEKFTSHVTFQSKKGIQYWINPQGIKTNTTWNNNTLTITSKDTSNYIEIRAAIPLKQFDSDSKYANHSNRPGLEEMKKVQDTYELNTGIINVITTILKGLIVVGIIAPIVVYLKYGREPKIDYQGIYEREPPTKDKPLVVNALHGKSKFKDVGKPNMDGLKATIMDLINRKFISIDIVNDENELKDTILKISGNIDSLEKFEKDVISMLRLFEISNTISVNQMSDLLSNDDDMKKIFNEKYENWCSEFKNDYMSKKLPEYFISTGDDYIDKFGIALITIGVISAICERILIKFTNIPIDFVFPGILLIIIGFILAKMPSSIEGRWTKKGLEYHKKWNNFRKYLEDYSLIKEHPPESIVIWNEYLVYATSLGVAEEVYKSMKLEVDQNLYNTNDLFLFYHFGGFRTINTSFNVIATSSYVGGVGGGSGGGGGGAF